MQQGGSCSELVAQLGTAEHRCSYFQLVTDQDPILLDVSIKQNDVLFPAELSLNPKEKRGILSLHVSHGPPWPFLPAGITQTLPSSPPSATRT